LDATDLSFLDRLPPTRPASRLGEHARHRLFVEPRSHGRWLPLTVPDRLIEEAWALARLGPTSANGSPLRLVLLRTAENKARLLPALDKGNRDKSALAPLVAILAHDLEFWRQLPRLYPHADAAAWFRDDLALARETAFRNGTLQAAYLILALRALGLDVGAVSGFDAAAVNRLFFAGTTLEANFVCNIGYGDRSELKPRLPRLGYHDILHPLPDLARASASPRPVDGACAQRG
jgi:3-hydroxypropanoate dehydrogenase